MSTFDLPRGVTLRPLDLDDAGPLADAYTRNRERLAPWEPARPIEFFTEAQQGVEIERALFDRDAGSSLPLVLEQHERIVGRVNLTGIARGVSQSATLGYWIDGELAGSGVMSAAVGAALVVARDELGLHRVQAATLLHNAASQGVLRRNGFTPIGVAQAYVKIAGRWQDHVLFQRILEPDEGE
ncbi:GNAT family N-acetyltransferase [Frondihabitans australicus]|uniref:[SSU ribosomal protein S5P]-alanine acetyltransferase n=1 Tax=Frondihabitans australicus TaxID=386892 RepID=A0A495IK20_9MICO|nr:GNAT family protein [Frondihabitans australicus]RKR75465.1 [SSU ribosomal protein S5P]-alanine acetyltransferase [Frondihabitans australicus]